MLQYTTFTTYLIRDGVDFFSNPFSGLVVQPIEMIHSLFESLLDGFGHRFSKMLFRLAIDAPP